MKKIIHAVSIQAAPRKVFDAVATANGLSNWWTTIVSADERVGGIVDFTFLEEFNPDMKITALERPRLVAWTCVAGHDAWADNTFRFEIEARDGGSMLMFTQVYAQELDDEQYGIYNFNWGYYLESLRLYCQTGKGKPFDAD